MKSKKYNLTFWVTLFTFLIVVILNLVTSGLGILLLTTGVVDRIDGGGAVFPAIFVLLVSGPISLLVAFIVNKMVMRPVQEVVDSIDRIAEGDFSIRVKKSGITSFNQLITSVNQMAEELECTKLFHEEFVSSFSHEFNTPIVSIKGFATLLKDDDLEEDERQEFLDIIVSETRRLSAMSKNILLLTRLENQVIINDMAEFNPAEQIRKTILLLSHEWEAKNIVMNISLKDVTMHGNKDLFSQVLVNIISNAIKFSDDNSEINVTLRELNDEMIIEIEDHGIGIEEKKSKKIFDKFYQVDESRSESGNGLGLAIAQRIVQLHKGTIECISEIGVGTKIVIYFK